MDRRIWKLLELRHSSRTSLLPMPPSTHEECRGAVGMSYLFLMTSHAITLMTGVLAIVSLKELTPVGVWRVTELPVQVGLLAKRGAHVAYAAERVLSHALAKLKHQSKIPVSDSEVSGIEEILSSGKVYLSLLRNLVFEMRLAAIQQRLSATVERVPMIAIGTSIPGAQEVGSAIRQLTAQIMELELRFEIFEEKMS